MMKNRDERQSRLRQAALWLTLGMTAAHDCRVRLPRATAAYDGAYDGRLPLPLATAAYDGRLSLLSTPAVYDAVYLGRHFTGPAPPRATAPNGARRPARYLVRTSSRSGCNGWAITWASMP